MMPAGFSSTSLLRLLPHILLLWTFTFSGTRSDEYTNNDVVPDEPDVKPCDDTQQVCTSLFRYDANTVLQEGEYCACAGCTNPVWDEEDGQSITWYHFERADRMVQYKFCDRAVPKYTCKEDRDVAVIIRASTGGWSPRIKKIWCACPGGKYVLKGWMKVQEGSESFWEYTYTCKRTMCDLDRPCVRRYMNNEREKAKGYKFLCHCPEGQMCPTSKGPSLSYNEVTDESGQIYTNGYCRSNKGSPAQKQALPEESSTQNTHAHTET